MRVNFLVQLFHEILYQKGEKKWVLWMEFTWGLLFFNENSKVYDLNRRSIISFKNKKGIKMLMTFITIYIKDLLNLIKFHMLIIKKVN